MKLLVLSDLHLEFSEFPVPDVDYDVVVLAGDVSARAAKVPFWACRSTNFGESTPIVFVAGNHEFYGRVMSSVLTEMRQLSTGTNFHALDCSETVLHGVRFLGCTLWTDFALHIDTTEGLKSDVGRSSREAGSALADFRVINVEASAEANAPDGRAHAGRREFTPEDSIQLHFQHRAWLLQKLEEPFDGPTVVVTHHAPHRCSLASQYASDWVSGAFVNELPPCFFKVPVLWIHGHTHSSFDYQVGSCRVVCNPRGYALAGRHQAPENKSFDPAFVVEVRTEKFDMYWSLRNKTEDVQRALSRGDLRWARLAAFELGVRLSTTAVPPLHAGIADFQTREDANDQCVDAVLSMFGQELSRLVASLKKDEPARAAEVVQLLFKHLDTLDGMGER